MMDIKLVVAKGKTAVREIPLLNAITIIGRRNDCGLRIPSPLVSRQHCELTRSDSGLRVKDLGSSNGTFVNGSKVKQKDLKSGDTLGVGPIIFIVQLGASAVSPADTGRPVVRGADQAAEEEADFVVSEDFAATEAADVVVEGEAAEEEADFVVAEPADGANVILADDGSEAEAADFVLAEEAQGDTVHDVSPSRLQQEPAAEIAEIAEEAAEAEPEVPAEPKKKGGLFSRLFQRKEKKPKVQAESAKPAGKKAKPEPAPAAAPVEQAPVPIAAAEEAMPQFFAEEDESAEPKKAVGDDDLADFLMGLNEKDQ